MGDGSIKIRRKLARLILFFLIINYSLLITNCSRKLDPDPLSLTVRQNLAMLQTDPQFVMYFNFKKMRETDFWSKFISDSLINSERTFGSFLNVLKEATGVSISNGIDELYFSNSWIGDNAMVVKGTFDRKRVDEFTKTDTVYQKLSYPNNLTVYKKSDINFYFYFKDEFTVCASNYLKIIEGTFDMKDTSQTGLLVNPDAMKVIEHIKHKENLWMMSNQKLFIRGIFENFADMDKKPEERLEIDTTADTTQSGDNEFDLHSIYKKIDAVSFSLKMTGSLGIVMQNECEDEKASEELKNNLEGVIALVKLSSTFLKKKPTELMKIIERIKIDTYNKTVMLNVNIDEKQVEELRKQKVF